MNKNFMRSCRWMLLLPAMAFMSGFAQVDQETDRLRADNAALRAQLDALQKSCGLATTAAPVSTPAPDAKAAAANPPVPAASMAAPVQALPAPVPPPVVTMQTPSAQSTAAPAGYKLVPVNTPEFVDPLSPPYDKTGCSAGVFKGPPPAKWNNADNWLNIGRGQSMAEVESALGKEHFNADGHGRIEWQYGKCGDAVSGRVLFKDGKVVLWQAPSF